MIEVVKILAAVLFTFGCGQADKGAGGKGGPDGIQGTWAADLPWYFCAACSYLSMHHSRLRYGPTRAVRVAAYNPSTGRFTMVAM